VIAAVMDSFFDLFYLPPLIRILTHLGPTPLATLRQRIVRDGLASEERSWSLDEHEDDERTIGIHPMNGDWHQGCDRNDEAKLRRVITLSPSGILKAAIRECKPKESQDKVAETSNPASSGASKGVIHVYQGNEEAGDDRYDAQVFKRP
jgi:hypothetical protein